MKKRILIVGSANMDLSMNMYRMPKAGETLLDDGGVAYLPGGKGANAAIAFARLGADSVFVAKLGADLHGQRLYNYYKDAGINTSGIKVDKEEPTGLAVVMKEASGENRIIVYPGANAKLTSENISEAFASSPDGLYLGFEIPFETVLASANIAKGRGVPIFIDAAPADKEQPLEKLPTIEIFSPNETETLEYTGIKPESAETCLRAAIALSKRVKAKYIVIKMGARGAFIYDGMKYFIIPALSAGKAVDTTSAGDTFTAAMTLKYLETGDIRIAVRYGCAAAAITVTRRGSAGSVPTEDEVKRLMLKYEVG